MSERKEKSKWTKLLQELNLALLVTYSDSHIPIMSVCLSIYLLVIFYIYQYTASVV